MLPIKKIYIDSKFKTLDSVSNSNFKIDLQNTLLFTENTVFYVDDISIPHSWYTVEENINDRIYIYLTPKQTDQDFSGVLYVSVKIDSGNYSGADLAIELSTKIGLGFNSSSRPNIFNVTFNDRKNTIAISTLYNELKFKILTTSDIISKLNNTWLGYSYDSNNPHDMNDILRNTEKTSIFYDSNIPYVSGVLDLQLIRNIYIYA